MNFSAQFQEQRAEASTLLLVLLSVTLHEASIEPIGSERAASLRRTLQIALANLRRGGSAPRLGQQSLDAERNTFLAALDDLAAIVEQHGGSRSQDDRQDLLEALQRSIIAFEAAATDWEAALGREIESVPEAPGETQPETSSGWARFDSEPGLRTLLDAFLNAGAHQTLARIGRTRREGGIFVAGAWPAVEVALYAPSALSYVEAPIPPSPNLLISLPRSGLNWVRYCTERITGLRTPGTKRLVGGDGPVAFHRTHRAMSVRPYGDRLAAPLCDEHGRPYYERVAILVRNPCESLIRHAEGDVRKLLDLVQNLEGYEAFAGPKHCLYYEDIVNDVEPIRQLIAFFGAEERQPPPQSAAEVESWSNESRALYKGRHGEPLGTHSYVPGKGFDLQFHSRGFTAERKDAVAGFLRGANPQVFDCYLARYFG